MIKSSIDFVMFRLVTIHASQLQRNRHRMQETTFRFLRRKCSSQRLYLTRNELYDIKSYYISLLESTQTCLYVSPLQGSTEIPIHQMVQQSANRVDNAFQKHAWGNIVVSGANTMFPGFKERLQAELQKIAPPTFTKHGHFKLSISDNRKYAAWIGGRSMSLISGLPWITKDEWDEAGSLVLL